MVYRRGTVFLELTYTPFMKPAGTPTGAGASPAPSSAHNSAVSNTPIMPHDKVSRAARLLLAVVLAEDAPQRSAHVSQAEWV